MLPPGKRRATEDRPALPRHTARPVSAACPAPGAALRWSQGHPLVQSPISLQEPNLSIWWYPRR